MAFLFLFFTVALSLCVVGLVVIALAAILGRLRDDWKLKKIERERAQATTEFNPAPPCLWRWRIFDLHQIVPNESSGWADRGRLSQPSLRPRKLRRHSIGADGGTRTRTVPPNTRGATSLRIGQ